VINGSHVSAEVREQAERPVREGLIRLLIRKLVVGYGKARRYYLSHFRPGYVRRMRALRRGECRRCGQCCSLFFRCPFLQEGNQCTIYERRFQQCRDFPIDERDISGPHIACGFRFDGRAGAGTTSDPETPPARRAPCESPSHRTG